MDISLGLLSGFIFGLTMCVILVFVLHAGSKKHYGFDDVQSLSFEEEHAQYLKDENPLPIDSEKRGGE